MRRGDLGAELWQTLGIGPRRWRDSRNISVVMGRTRTVSIAQILDDDKGLYLHEAIALGRQLGAHPVAESEGSFPAADRIAIMENGSVAVLPGDTTARATTAVMWLGGILHAVVACADDGREALPVGLKFTIARASGWTFDDPSRPADLGAFSPHGSVTELLEAIRRYAPIDERAVLRTLFQRCAFRLSFAPDPEPGMAAPDIPLAAVEAAPDPDTAAHTPAAAPRPMSAPSLTLRLDGARPRIELRSIEDLRRVREAAGVTIDAIRAATNIPSTLIRDLERGDFKHWPRGVFARAYLTTYAQEIGVVPADVLRLAGPDVTLNEGGANVERLRRGERVLAALRETIESLPAWRPLRPGAAIAGVILIAAWAAPAIRSGGSGARNAAAALAPAPAQEQPLGTMGQARQTASQAAADRQRVTSALTATVERTRQLEVELESLEPRIEIEQENQESQSVAVRDRMDAIYQELSQLDAQRRRLSAELRAFDRRHTRPGQ